MTKRRPDSTSKRGPKPPKRHNSSQSSKRHDGSQQDALLVENPKTALPEAMLSETVLSETVLPETVLPETVLPEMASPETASSETVLPETVLPETVLSEAALPQTALPETDLPEIDLPETGLPETDLPETGLPETVLQNAAKQTTDNDLREGIKFSYANANVLAYQAKLLEVAQANMQFALECAHRLTTIRSPVEFPSVIAELTSKRIAMFWKHSTEMAELSTKR